MRVGIYTNLHERCGNAAYARDLQTELQKYFTVEMVENFNSVVEQRFDCVLVNWHPTRVLINADMVCQLQAVGSKVILILQNSFDWAGPPGEMLELVNRVVAHEPMEVGIPVEFIPHGIPVVDGLHEPTEKKIGVAGFPFQWKRFDVVAEAARTFGVKCCIVAPESDQMSSQEFIEGIRGHLGGLAEIHEEWLPVDEVVRLLSECTLNIFWYECKDMSDALGQTGSARMGVASRRPMVISQHRKFRTFEPYLDEFYVAPAEADVYHFTEEILAAPDRARRPKRMLEEQGWPQAGERYRDLIGKVNNSR